MLLSRFFLWLGFSSPNGDRVDIAEILAGLDKPAVTLPSLHSIPISISYEPRRSSHYVFSSCICTGDVIPSKPSAKVRIGIWD